jgi:hypothetical protein
VIFYSVAFFDIGHAPADHGNRRTDLQGYAAWEIHPVMKMEVIQSSNGKSSRIAKFTLDFGATFSFDRNVPEMTPHDQAPKKAKTINVNRKK